MEHYLPDVSSANNKITQEQAIELYRFVKGVYWGSVSITGNDEKANFLDYVASQATALLMEIESEDSSQ